MAGVIARFDWRRMLAIAVCVAPLAAWLLLWAGKDPNAGVLSWAAGVLLYLYTILLWVHMFGVWIVLALTPSWRLLAVMMACVAPLAMWWFVGADSSDHAGVIKGVVLFVFCFVFVIGAVTLQISKELRAGVFWSGLKETAAAFFARRPVIGDEKEATASENQTSPKS